MSQQGDSHKRQEDDWWRQLYDEEARAGTSSAAARDSIDEHFDSALTAMNRPPAPTPAADTLRLRRPTPPPPPPSWPRPKRGPEMAGERSPAAREPAADPGPADEPAADPGPPAAEPPPWDAWAARPMFPAEASGSWAEAPPAAQPWSPSPPAPADGTPRPAEPWTSPPPDEPAAEPPVSGGRERPPLDRPPEPRQPEAPPTPHPSGGARPPAARTPDPAVDPARKQTAPDPYAPPGAWPPIGRPPETAPSEQEPSGSTPYASPDASPSVGRTPEPDAEDARDEVPPASESGPFGRSPYGSPGAWPPVGRTPEADAGAYVRPSDAAPSEQEPSGSTPYASPDASPSVGRTPEPDAEDARDEVPPASESGPFGRSPYASPGAWPPLGREPEADAGPYVRPSGAEPSGGDSAESGPPTSPEVSPSVGRTSEAPGEVARDEVPPALASGSLGRSPYASPGAWPPLGREPEADAGPYVRPSGAEPSGGDSAESGPPTSPEVSPSVGRTSEAPGEVARDEVPRAPESGSLGRSPYASPGAWPPLGRTPEADAGPYVRPSGAESPEGASSESGSYGSPEDSPPGAGQRPLGPGPNASSAAWPPVGRAAEPDAEDGARGAGETAFGEGGVRWAPELPPGWVAAEGEGEPAAAVVGGGPPTYEAEPTAWPEADPDRLDGLVPDTVLDGAQYGPLTLRTACVRGDSARYRGQPRRDAVLTARFGAGDDALLLVATATGARAADDAHRAARDAVHWIAGAVGRSRERLAGDLRAARRGSLKSGLHRLTDRCYGRLRARGEDLGLEEGEYTASLRCLLLPADPECRIRLFFGVGAGGLFRIRSGAWQDLDIAPDDAAAPFRFRATLAQPGDALLMCSAGLAEPLRGEPALAARLAERWDGGRVPGLAGYLADVQTRVKGYADDRTAVTVWDA